MGGQSETWNHKEQLHETCSYSQLYSFSHVCVNIFVFDMCVAVPVTTKYLTVLRKRPIFFISKNKMQLFLGRGSGKQSL